jgi:hypothetical protein
MAEWELNYADKEALRPYLVPRIKEAARKYLLYVQGGGGNMSQNRKDWCTANIANLDSISQQLSNYLMSEPTFIAGGTSITDAAIGIRVESVILTHFMPAAT